MLILRWTLTLERWMVENFQALVTLLKSVIFISWFMNPPTVIFRKVYKTSKKIFFYFIHQ